MKYQIVVVYKDLSVKTENTDTTIPNILNALAIYAEDPDFLRATVYDWTTKRDVITVEED